MQKQIKIIWFIISAVVLFIPVFFLIYSQIGAPKPWNMKYPTIPAVNCIVLTLKKASIGTIKLEKALEEFRCNMQAKINFFSSGSSHNFFQLVLMSFYAFLKVF